MNLTKHTDSDDTNEDVNIVIKEESFWLFLEDTLLQEQTPNKEYIQVQEAQTRKGKLDAVQIRITMEAPLIMDIEGLSTRKKKCTRMRGLNINLQPNK